MESIIDDPHGLTSRFDDAEGEDDGEGAEVPPDSDSEPESEPLSSGEEGGVKEKEQKNAGKA